MSDTWPPPSGLSTILVPRNSTVHSISARTTIHAPAPLIFATLLDTSHYPEWNSFCPTATITSQPPSSSPHPNHIFQKSTRFTAHVIMNPAKPTSHYATPLLVTDISTPSSPSPYVPPQVLENDPTFHSDLNKVYRIAWTVDGGLVSRGLRSERFSEVIALDDEGGRVKGCEYRTWECQGGLLARTIKWTYGGVLPGRFEAWCVGLKGECERMVGEGEGGDGVMEGQREEGGR